MEQHDYIGVDVGGTKTAAALCRAGTVLERIEEPTPTRSLAELTGLISRLCGPWLDRTEGIGVCTPGYHDPRSGTISLAGNLPALTGTDLRTHLSAALGRPVAVGNDADAAALAEYHLGAARAWDSVFYLTVSTGIGGGFVNAAGVLRGHSGSAAEIGHLRVRDDGLPCTCGATGCLEAHASGTAIARQASERSGSTMSTREVFSAWRAGDDAAGTTVRTAAAAIGRALYSVTQLLDPEGILLGGGVAAGNPDFVELVGTELAGSFVNRVAPRLAVAGLGADAGVLGAALLPLDRS